MEHIYPLASCDLSERFYGLQSDRCGATHEFPDAPPAPRCTTSTYPIPIFGSELIREGLEKVVQSGAGGAEGDNAASEILHTVNGQYCGRKWTRVLVPQPTGRRRDHNDRF